MRFLSKVKIRGNLWKSYTVRTCSFQILDPTTEMKDSGGIHNTTLNLGPPAQFMHAGRYICLVNNPEGHAHKEIFVRVLTDSQMQAFPSLPASTSGKLFLRIYQTPHKNFLDASVLNQLCTECKR